MASNRRAGGATVPLLFLVLLLGLGAYNYHRNWTAESAAQGPRPFESYATGDLEQLRDAYNSEIVQLERHYSAQERRRVRARSEGLMMGERLDEFERVQRTSGKLREIGTEVADRQARLRDVEKELEYRVALKAGLELHLQRLTSI